MRKFSLILLTFTLFTGPTFAQKYVMPEFADNQDSAQNLILEMFYRRTPSWETDESTGNIVYTQPSQDGLTRTVMVSSSGEMGFRSNILKDGAKLIATPWGHKVKQVTIIIHLIDTGLPLSRSQVYDIDEQVYKIKKELSDIESILMDNSGFLHLGDSRQDTYIKKALDWLSVGGDILVTAILNNKVMYSDSIIIPGVNFRDAFKGITQ